MAFFDRCHSSCEPCQNLETRFAEGPLKVKMCSWAEEEVDFDGSDAGDFGFLGKVTSAPKDSSRSSWTSCSSSHSASEPLNGSGGDGDFVLPQRPVPKSAPASALYQPGGLVLVRDLERLGGPPAMLTQRYTMDSQAMGRGSYGEVVAATHRRTGARRAIKFVNKAGLQRYVDDPSAFVRREVDILRRLDHPNIVRMYEAHEDEQTTYIVLELCDGGDLLERVTVAHMRMPETAAASLLTQMLSAVQHMWQLGIVHRDLKPENFLFLHRETEREPLPPVSAPVKLIDFGLSRRLSFGTGARVTPKIGTAEYMAPEAYAGVTRPALADRMDVWSLGVVLHVIFIGHFPSPRLTELSMEEYLSLPCWQEVSPLGKEFLGLLLRSDPNRRPSVTAALQHPWLAAASAALGEVPSRLARGLPACIRNYAEAPALRRLALTAVAREVDESSLCHLRSVYYAIQAACGGAITRTALRQAVMTLPQPIAGVAAELERRFSIMDVDGSGGIDWTELVAMAVGSCDDAALRGCLAPVTDRDCFRAFDLLGQGAPCVSASSLAALFFNGSGECGVAGGDFGPRVGRPMLPAWPNKDELARVVSEVDSSGAVDAAAFSALVHD